MRSRSLFTGLGAVLVAACCLTTLLAAATPDSLVADAAMRGDAAGVRELLKQAADVNAAQGDGMTALHWAADKGDVELARLLLVAGANVRASTRIGAYTPVFLAARSGHAAVVKTLLEAGADTKAGSPSGTTPLMVAAASGHAEAVAVLLEHGADPNATESVRGNTALTFAAASNRAAVIELLLKRGADHRITTKVTDLSALTRDRIGFVGGNPPVPGQPAPGGQGAQEEPSAGAPKPEGQQGRSPAPEPNAASASQAGQRPGSAAAQTAAGGERAGGAPARRPQVAGVDRQFQLNELVAYHGGLTPLLFAARQGYLESAQALVNAGADVNQTSEGDKTSPLLMAIINGHFDLAQYFVEKGADPTLASENGVTPLYAALNVQWAPKALYPQPRAYQQQKATYLDVMTSVLEHGADPNARLKKKVWYSGYSFDLSGVDEIGATPFWRAAYAADVEAMRLLVEHGADPNIRTMKPAGRPRTGDAERQSVDVSGLPPVPLGAPSVAPLHAAAGVGYGEGFAANAHRFAPGGMLAAVKYLVEELGVDVNAIDHEGNTALHHAAARGDNEMIIYLVSRGADVTVVNREGQTITDMANGPVQRIQPFPDTVALLMKLGSKNSNKCVSC
jgi:uncharacterized protein